MHRRCAEGHGLSVARGPCTSTAAAWAFGVDADFHPESGLRRQVLRQGFPTKKAAQEGLNELICANSRGSVVTRSTISVKAYLANWLATAKSKPRPSTLHSDAMAVDRINARLAGEDQDG